MSHGKCSLLGIHQSQMNNSNQITIPQIPWTESGQFFALHASNDYHAVMDHFLLDSLINLQQSVCKNTHLMLDGNIETLPSEPLLQSVLGTPPNPPLTVPPDPYNHVGR